MQTATVIQIQERFALICPENMPPSGACLFWSMATVDILREAGHNAILQAGSMSWPRIKPEHDDGIMATHFTYQWEPDSAETKTRIANDLMPEMHVWVALPDTNEIIDLTTRYLPEQCRDRAGLAWTAEQPPDYLWCEASKPPQGVYYEPEISACRLALAMAYLGVCV